jgi:hypothetical protein
MSVKRHGNDFLFGDYSNDSLTGGFGVDGLEGRRRQRRAQ